MNVDRYNPNSLTNNPKNSNINLVMNYQSKS